MTGRSPAGQLQGGVDHDVHVIGAAAVVFGTSLINLLSGKEGQVPG